MQKVLILIWQRYKNAVKNPGRGHQTDYQRFRQGLGQKTDPPLPKKKKKKITHLQGKTQGKGWLARHRVHDKLARNVGKWAYTQGGQLITGIAH